MKNPAFIKASLLQRLERLDDESLSVNERYQLAKTAVKRAGGWNGLKTHTIDATIVKELVLLHAEAGDMKETIAGLGVLEEIQKYMVSQKIIESIKTGDMVKFLEYKKEEDELVWAAARSQNNNLVSWILFRGVRMCCPCCTKDNKLYEAIRKSRPVMLSILLRRNDQVKEVSGYDYSKFWKFRTSLGNIAVLHGDTVVLTLLYEKGYAINAISTIDSEANTFLQNNVRRSAGETMNLWLWFTNTLFDESETDKIAALGYFFWLVAAHSTGPELAIRLFHAKVPTWSHDDDADTEPSQYLKEQKKEEDYWFGALQIYRTAEMEKNESIMAWYKSLKK